MQEREPGDARRYRTKVPPDVAIVEARRKRSVRRTLCCPLPRTRHSLDSADYSYGGGCSHQLVAPSSSSPHIMQVTRVVLHGRDDSGRSEEANACHRRACCRLLTRLCSRCPADYIACRTLYKSSTPTPHPPTFFTTMAAAAADVPHFTFNNGTRVPSVGLGCVAFVAGLRARVDGSADAGWASRAGVSARTRWSRRRCPSGTATSTPRPATVRPSLPLPHGG